MSKVTVKKKLKNGKIVEIQEERVYEKLFETNKLGFPNVEPINKIVQPGYECYVYENEDGEDKWKFYIQLSSRTTNEKDFGKLTLHNMYLLDIMHRACNYYGYDWKFDTSTGQVFVTTRTEQWYFYPFIVDNKKGIWHANTGLNKGYHFQRRDNCSAEENIRFFHFHECETYRVPFKGDIAEKKNIKGKFKKYRPNSFKRRFGVSRASRIHI